MIRIITLQDHKKELASTDRLRELTDQLRLAEVDVLCFQGIQRTFDGKQDPASKISESLQMTCSFSAYNSNVSTNEREQYPISGLSILAGTDVWMLNSGSFYIPSENPQKKQVAQFAVIRQNCDSILVINMEYSPEKSVQLQQLRAVFSHPFLKESFDAVILCSNGNLALSRQDFETATHLSGYKLAFNSQAIGCCENNFAIQASSCGQQDIGHSKEGAIFTLIPKSRVPASVEIHCASATRLLDSALTSEIKFHQIRTGKKNLFSIPLSYSEKWPGSKNPYRAYPASTA